MSAYGQIGLYSTDSCPQRVSLSLLHTLCSYCLPACHCALQSCCPLLQCSLVCPIPLPHIPSLREVFNVLYRTWSSNLQILPQCECICMYLCGCIGVCVPLCRDETTLCIIPWVLSLVLRQDLSLVQMPVYLAQGIPGILTFPLHCTGIVDAWCSTSVFFFFLNQF